MKPKRYKRLKAYIIAAGYEHEIEWSENLKPCTKAFDFFCEYTWVVLNSGMKNQIAAVIWERVKKALTEGQLVSSVFGHPGKSTAIQQAWRTQEFYFDGWRRAKDKIEYLQSLPWIGPITKWHLAKNLGLDCCKPDRHLVRIAKAEGTTPEILCQHLSELTGDRIATVDLVIWRAVNLGMI